MTIREKTIEDLGGLVLKFAGVDPLVMPIEQAIVLLMGQPDIVRCKDCRYYWGNGFCNRSGIHLEVNDNWFCADGERRDSP